MRLILHILGEEIIAISQMMCSGRGLGGERRLYSFWSVHLECSVNLIGGNMVEAAFPLRSSVIAKMIRAREGLPIQSRSLKEGQGTHHIGAGKGEGVLDGAVHVALRRQMYDAVNLLFAYQGQNAVKIADVGLDEAVVRLVLNIPEIGQIACVCQFIKIDYSIIRILFNKEPNDVTAYESGASGNE